MMLPIRTAISSWRRPLLVVGLAILLCSSVLAEQPLCKNKGAAIKAEYPEFARKMKIFGVVRLELQLTPAGSVRGSKVLGGNPVLASAAQQAVKPAKFEGTEPCVVVFEFKQ